MVVCTRCGRTFKSQQGLSGHMRLRHSSTPTGLNAPTYVPGLLQAKAENAKLREQLATLQTKLTQMETVSKKNLEIYTWQTSELQRKNTILVLEFNNQSEIHKIETNKLSDERNLFQVKAQELQNKVSILEKEIQNKVSVLEAVK
jgi:hypothetical protein